MKKWIIPIIAAFIISVLGGCEKKQPLTLENCNKYLTISNQFRGTDGEGVYESQFRSEGDVGYKGLKCITEISHASDSYEVSDFQMSIKVTFEYRILSGSDNWNMTTGAMKTDSIVVDFNNNDVTIAGDGKKETIIIKHDNTKKYDIGQFNMLDVEVLNVSGTVIEK